MSLLPKSLRGRITTVSALVSAAVLIGVAILILVVQRQQLLQNIDDSLQREADAVAASLSVDPAVDLARSSRDRFIQITTSDGQVLDASSALLLGTPVVTIGQERQRFATLPSTVLEDDEFRVLAQQVTVGDQIRVVVAGENTDDLRDSLRDLLLTLLLLVPLTAALLGALAWIMAGRTLAPVDAIQQEVENITINRLGDRVAVPASGDEIAELAVTMNAMLDRLDNANEQQKRFVADASHELRSPLTRLRASLETDLNNDTRDLNITGHELLGDVDDLQKLIDDLLFLARQDGAHANNAGQRGAYTIVDLDAVVDRAVEQLASPTSGAGVPIAVDTTLVQPVAVHGNERHLGRLISNVLANAVRYAARSVWIELSPHADQAVLIISDDGPGIARENRDHVFDRFARLDESRTGATGGTGLGLAIARDIALAHDGTIRIEDSTAGGACFVLALPLEDAGGD